jgi:hypothetical protein
METADIHPELFGSESTNRVNKFKKKIGYTCIIFIVQFILLNVLVDFLSAVKDSQCSKETPMEYTTLTKNYRCFEIVSEDSLFTLSNRGFAYSIVILVINVMVMIATFFYLGWSECCRTCVYD